MPYKTVKYNGEMSQLQDPALVAQVKQAFINAEQHNNTLYREYQNKHAQMVSMAVEMFGEKHRVAKYLQSNKPPKPVSTMKAFEKLMRQFDKWLEQERRRQQRRAQNERRKKTVNTLKSLGYVPNEHFSPSAPMTFAKLVLEEISPGVFAPRMLPEGTSQAQ